MSTELTTKKEALSKEYQDCKQTIGTYIVNTACRFILRGVVERFRTTYNLMDENHKHEVHEWIQSHAICNDVRTLFSDETNAFKDI